MSGITYKRIFYLFATLLMGVMLMFPKEIIQAVTRNHLNVQWLQIILGPERLEIADGDYTTLSAFEESCNKIPQLCFYSAKGFSLLRNPVSAMQLLMNPQLQASETALDLYWWGKIFFEAGDLQKGRDIWDQASILRVIAEIQYDEGVRFSQRSQLEQALSKFEQAALIDPSFGMAHFRSGQIYWTFGKWQSANQAYLNALDTLPADTFHWYVARGKNCLIDQDLICEVAAFAKAVELNPNDYAALMHSARGLIKQGKDDQAESALTQAQLVNPTSQETYLLLGNLYLRLRKWELALSEFQTGLEKANNPLDYWLGMAEVYAEMDQVEEALDMLQKVFSVDPDNQQALNLWSKLQPPQ